MLGVVFGLEEKKVDTNDKKNERMVVLWSFTGMISLK